MPAQIRDIDEVDVRRPEIETSPADEYQLTYIQRAAFRPKLMEFFEQTNKRQGSYVWAEEQAYQYFEKLGIPRSAWAYRTGRR